MILKEKPPIIALMQRHILDPAYKTYTNSSRIIVRLDRVVSRHVVLLLEAILPKGALSRLRCRS